MKFSVEFKSNYDDRLTELSGGFHLMSFGKNKLTQASFIRVLLITLDFHLFGFSTRPLPTACNIIKTEIQINKFEP